MKIAKSLVKWSARLLVGFFAVLTVCIMVGVMQARIILSDSMEPSIHINDLVIGASWISPEPGQVALYQERDVSRAIRQDVVHRVVSVNGSGKYVFKGDNNISVDALEVDRSDIKGVIIAKIPAVGTFFSVGGGLAVAAMIFGIWAISFGIRRLSSANEPKHEEN